METHSAQPDIPRPPSPPHLAPHATPIPGSRPSPRQAQAKPNHRPPPHPAGGESTPSQPNTHPTTIRPLDRRLHASYRQLSALRHWFVRHVTPAGAFLFWATLAAGAFNDVSLTMAHELFGLLFCLLLGAVLWLRKPAQCFELQRFVPQNASVGSPFHYRIRLSNHSRAWQRGLDFHEGIPDSRPSLEEFVQFAEPGEERRNWFDRRYRAYRWAWLARRNIRAMPVPVPVPDVPPGAAVELACAITPLRRGRLSLRGAHLARTDPFGLIRRDVVVTETTDSIVVYPRRFQLPAFSLPGEGRRLHTGGVAMAGSVGDSEEFVSVREYRPGDPLRRIHWAGWARTQRAVVKEYQEEFFVRHALLLDTCGGGPAADAFEDAVSLAASFAFTVDEHDSLLDLMFVGDRAYNFTAGRGLAHNEQMLQILAGVALHPSQDFSSLENLVLRHVGQLSGCILVLLAWDEPRQHLHQRLRSLGLPLLTFVVQAPTSPTPPSDDVHWITPGQAQQCLARMHIHDAD